MRVLLSWLGDYLEWTGRGRDLAPILTEAGFPVPSVEEIPPGGGFPADAVLDVEITSNRGDAMSHLGIAREVAAATGQALRNPPSTVPPPAAAGEERVLPVAVEAGDLCPVYEARLLVGASNGGPTPARIRRRLEALGQRSVNPVVDITNYVMLDRGQPLHAFDAAKLRGGRIVVRRSRAGEAIETIDGRRRVLPAGLLVIADAERPVAVAGLMGGRDSEVGPGTREIVIESALFAPAAVRASAAALGLATEASARFARRVDPSGVGEASLRAAALAAEAASCRSAGVVRAGPGPEPAPRDPVPLRFERLRSLLGIRVDPRVAADILESLSIRVVERTREGLRAVPPSWRWDIAIEEDLAEEVARILGYGRIPATLSLPVRPVPPRREGRAAAAARGALAAAGFREALTLPFVAPGLPDDASPWTSLPAIRVDNPTRSEEPLLRRSLLGPLLRCLERNRARGVAGARLFELAAVFLPDGGGPRPREHLLLSGVLEGEYPDARGAVEAVAESLGLAGRLVPERAPADATVRPLDRERTARLVLDGRTAGWAGEILAADLEGLGVHREGLRAAAFELDYEALAAAASLDRDALPVPVHPVATRDLAVVLPLSVSWAAVEERSRAAGGALLRAVELFDDYRGRGVPAGSRSLAFRLVFGAPDRTLRGEEVDGAVAAVVAALESGLGGRLRA